MVHVWYVHTYIYTYIYNILTYIQMANKYKPVETKDITTQLFSQNHNKNLAWPGLPHLTLVKPDWCPDSDPGWFVRPSVRPSVTRAALRRTQGSIFVVQKCSSSSSSSSPVLFPGPVEQQRERGRGSGRFGGGDGDDEEARRKGKVVCGGGRRWGEEKRGEGRCVGSCIPWILASSSFYKMTRCFISLSPFSSAFSSSSDTTTQLEQQQAM